MQNTLSQLLAAADIELPATAQQQLLDYLALLQRWNKIYNLTAVRTLDDMLIRHIMDSLVVRRWLTGKRFIDVGSGAGLPGVPLAISLPNHHFTLLDSLGKRVRFLRQVQQQLALTNVDVVQSRVEEFLPLADNQGMQPQNVAFDGIISRAFASLADMLHWCRHLAGEHSRFYALKGQLTAEELTQIPGGFHIDETITLQVPQLNAERHLLIIRAIDAKPAIC